jgi:ABC-type multidrug transport system fused ATPase/permease subunit
MEKIKRFLEPLRWHKKYGIIVAITWAIDGTWWFMYPWIYSNIVNLLTNSQDTGIFSQEVWRFGLMYGGFMVIFFAIDYCTRNTSMLFIQETMKDIYKKYLSKFFVMDNNHGELIWTGKLIQITASGAWSWIDLLRNITQDRV